MAITSKQRARHSFNRAGKILAGRIPEFNHDILIRRFEYFPYETLSTLSRDALVINVNETSLSSAEAFLTDTDGWKIEINAGWANDELAAASAKSNPAFAVTTGEPDYSLIIKDKKGSPIAAIVIGDNQVIELDSEDGGFGLNKSLPKWLKYAHFFGTNPDGEFVAIDPNSSSYGVRENSRYFGTKTAKAHRILTEILAKTYPNLSAPAPQPRDTTKTTVVVVTTGRTAQTAES